MAVFHGVGVNWGVDSTVIGVNGLFQTREHAYKADSDLIKDGGETTVSKVYWDFREEASFVYIAFQPGYYPYGNAFVDIPYQFGVPALGRFIQVTDPRYPAIAGYWLVDEIQVSASNTSAAKVTLSLSRYPHLQII